MSTTEATETAAPPAEARAIASLPGPAGLPWIGNALQVDHRRLHLRLEAWAREHGSAYRVRFFGRELVVFSDPDAVATILRNRPGGFRRPPRLAETAREFGFTGLFSADGDTWRRQRPMVLAGLDPAHLKAFFPALTRITQRFEGRWRRAARSGASVDVQADLRRYTVDVTAGLAFGRDINTIEAGEDRIQAHLDKVLPSLYRRMIAPVPYWRYVRLPADRALEQHLAALGTAVAGFIADTRQRLREQPDLARRPTNMIEAMVVERDRPGSTLVDEDLAGNVLGMLLAGEDTTADALAWMVWLLHRNPRALERAREEVLRVLGPAGRVVAHEQLARLDYVNACAMEAMRLKPGFPLISLQASQDTVVGGVALPARSVVVCLMRSAGLDPARVPEPQAFEPERWLDAPGAATSTRRAVMPFGAGARMCPGRYLALAEIKMVTAMLLSQFEIDSATLPEGDEAAEWLGFTMSPLGLRMSLRERERASAEVACAAA